MSALSPKFLEKYLIKWGKSFEKIRLFYSFLENYGESIMAAPLKNLPSNWEASYLLPTVRSTVEIENETIINQIAGLCKSIITDLLRDDLSRIKSTRGFADVTMQVKTNATNATTKWIDDNTQDLEAFWEKNQESLSKLNFDEDRYWTCVQWIPANCITFLLEDHAI